MYFDTAKSANLTTAVYKKENDLRNSGGYKYFLK